MEANNQANLDDSDARRVARGIPLADRAFRPAPDEGMPSRQDPAPLLKKIRHTFELIRFSHTLFALPFALASMLVAAKGFPPARTFLLILGCMVLARTSAMAFNRYADASLDEANPRTQNRHIPAGILSKEFVLSLALLSGLCFIALTYLLNILCFILSPAALLIIWFYSLTKRFTHYTQLFLGLALGISPVAAWIAVTGTFAWPPILLGGAVTFWVAGFDIFYATQDYDFDRKQGLKSLVVKYGLEDSFRLARFFHFTTALLLLSFAFFVPSTTIYLLTSLVVIVLLFYEHTLVSPDDLSRVNRAFFALNGWIGIIFLAGTSISIFVV